MRQYGNTMTENSSSSASELLRLRTENERFVEFLENHNIEWRVLSEPQRKSLTRRMLAESSLQAIG